MPTHRIGASLLRGEWKTAVSMILDPREGDILVLFKCIFVSRILCGGIFLTEGFCGVLSMALQQTIWHVFLNLEHLNTKNSDN